METIYRIMEALLPFEYMRYDFMKNALLAVLLITISSCASNSDRALCIRSASFRDLFRNTGTLLI